MTRRSFETSGLLSRQSPVTSREAADTNCQHWLHRRPILNLLPQCLSYFSDASEFVQFVRLLRKWAICWQDNRQEFTKAGD